MSGQFRSHEDDLDIFKGMDGFEGLAEDDSILVALLDDLQENTLLTLMGDNLLQDDLQFGETNFSTPPPIDDCVPMCGIERLQVDVNCRNGGNSDAKQCKRQRREHQCEDTKRLRLDRSPTEDLVLKYKTSSSHSNSNSDEDTSNEEGNSSDTGYDTMSSSASPGSTSSSKPLSQHSTPIVQKGLTHASDLRCIDPVALIDERIKHYMCSREVNLTEEEKEILKAEGLPIPTTLPLTKVEEKALKNVRRKIRNRVAAQESRKRKKELVQTLEDRVSEYCHENKDLKKRVEALENENKSLLEQLRKLQAMISSSNNNRTKVGTCIMVIILCFAVFFGGTSPSNLWSTQKYAEYTTTSVRSRSLLSVDPSLNFPGRACDWFKQIFMKQQLEYSELQSSSSSNHATRLHNHGSEHTSAKYDTVVVALSKNQSL